MLARLFPRTFDNLFPGRRPALYLFALILLMKLVMGVNCIIIGERVVREADGVPLETYGTDAAATVLAMFAMWGLAQVIYGLLGVLAMFRYRAMVPLMYLVLLFEFLARKLILQALPIVRVGEPPGVYVNLALLTVIIIGLVLSLVPARHVKS